MPKIRLLQAQSYSLLVTYTIMLYLAYATQPIGFKNI